jgi:hypothetical protein
MASDEKGSACHRGGVMFDRADVRTGYISFRRRGWAMIPMTLLMLGLWLGLAGLGSSDHLHHWVHSDSHQTNHECLVTLFHKSLLFHSPELATAPLAVFVWFGISTPVFELLLPLSDLRLAPSRAPPFISFLHS